MGWLKKLVAGIKASPAIVAVLPIPDKYKKTVADVGKVEMDVETVITDVHPPKPAA